MKKTISLILISIFLMGCNLPFTIAWNNSSSPESTTAVAEIIQTTEAPIALTTQPPATQPPATQEPLNGTELNLGGVYMVLPPCLASGASGTLIAAVPYDEMNGPMEYYPENRKITFQGYPLSNKFFSVDDPDKTGGLVIYPVAEYVAMNQAIADEVSSLQAALAAQPAVPATVPLLPTFNAAQVFKAQDKYLTFQNGQGFRYLTEYSQYYAPINNHDLFYSYQGLTNDGKYWVSAIFPVNAAFLQESSDSASVPNGGISAPSWDSPTFDADMATYYSEMISLLNSTPDGNFTPGLDCLDQFISSLSIGD